jgi:O-antigen/teichoic acid export membrane protein
MKLSVRTFFIMLDKISVSVLQLAVAFVLVRLIDKELYGSYRQVILIGSIAASLSNFGLPESVYYFLPSMPPEQRHRRLGMILSLTIIIGASFSVCMFIFAGFIAQNINNPELANALRIFAVSPLIQVVRLTLSNSLIATDRALVSTVVSILTMVAKFTVVIAGFAMTFQIEYVLIAYLAVEVLSMVMLALLQMRKSSFTAFILPEIPFYREVICFSFPIAVASLMAVSGRYLGNYMISVFQGPVRFAEYYNGAQELPFVGIFTISIATAVLPNMVQCFRNGNINGMCSLFSETMRRSSLVLLPVFAWAIIVSQDIILILYGPDYSRSWYPFLVYLFLLPMRIALYTSILRAIGKTKFLIYSPMVMIATNALLGYTLLKWWGDRLIGFIGPAIGNVLGMYMAAICTSYFVKREVKRLGYYGRLFPVKEYLATFAATIPAAAVAWCVTRMVTSSSVSYCLSLGGLSPSSVATTVPVLAGWARCFIGLVAIVVSFAIAGTVFGAIKPEDLHLVSGLIGRFFPWTRKINISIIPNTHRNLNNS